MRYTFRMIIVVSGAVALVLLALYLRPAFS